MSADKKQLAVIRYKDHYVSAVLDGNVLDNVIAEECGVDAIRTGDIFVGRVSHVVKNINAAFVEIRKGTMCYLPLKEKETKKIAQGQEFPVQIKKAAVKTKQAVVSRKLEFPGKYVVVTTENLTKNISSKIENPDVRGRLQTLLERYQDEPFGIILRTECQDIPEEQIHLECRELLDQAKRIIRDANSRTCFSRLHRSGLEVLRFIKDFPKGTFERIITDIPELYEQFESMPFFESENIVLYEDSSYPLDKLLGIGTKLEKALLRHVWLKSGASLVIEPTEALTVIDVNTEKAIEGKRNTETTFFNINMEAAREAARQIRVRNISGIILIDFIDMKKKEHTEALLHELEREFQKDKVKTTVVDMTKLGLVEITRMKLRKPLHEIFH